MPMNSLPVQFLSLIFGAMFWTLVLCGMSSLAWLFVEGLVFIIRLFKPSFLQGYKYKEVQTSQQSESHERKRIALDFIIAERIRRQNEIRRITRRFDPLPTAAPQINIPEEITLDAIKGLAAELDRKIQHEQTDPAALYALFRTIEGKKRYLCRKTVRRNEKGEIKSQTIFAPLIGEAIKLDLIAAERLRRVLGAETFIEPINAAARLRERRMQINVANQVTA